MHDAPSTITRPETHRARELQLDSEQFEHGDVFGGGGAHEEVSSGGVKGVP